MAQNSSVPPNPLTLLSFFPNAAMIYFVDARMLRPVGKNESLLGLVMLSVHILGLALSVGYEISVAHCYSWLAN